MSIYVHDGTNPTEYATTQIGALFVAALAKQSTALLVSTIIPTDASEFVVPVLTADPETGWYNEGETIAESDPETDQEAVRPRKVAGLTTTSNEAWADNPMVRNIVMRGLARDVSRKVNRAYFTETPIAKAPPGVGLLAGVTEIDAGASWTDFDWADEGSLTVEGMGFDLTAWVANTATAKALHAVKTGTGSNASLLQPTASERVLRSVRGVPLLVDDEVADGTVWGIPSAASLAVVRKDTEVLGSSDAFFASDKYAVRAVARIAFGFPLPEAVVKVTLSTP